MFIYYFVYIIIVIINIILLPTILKKKFNLLNILHIFKNLIVANCLEYYIINLF